MKLITKNAIRLVSFAVALAMTALSVPAAASAITGWTTPVSLSTTDRAGNGDGISFAVASDGTLFAAWSAWDGSGYVAQVAHSVDAGVTWSAATTLSEPGGHAESVEVATNAGGDVIVVWDFEDVVVWKVQFSTSTDHGQSWSTYGTVSDDTVSTSGSRIVGLGTNGFVVVMQAHNGAFFDVVSRTSINSGAAWSAFHQLSDGLSNSIFPDIAVDVDGHLAATWLSYIVGEYQIQASSSQDGGLTWGAISSLAAGNEVDDYPLIQAQSGGGFAVLWHSKEAGSHDILYSTSSNGGLTWSSALPVALGVGDDPQLTFASGPNQSAVVVWTQDDGTTQTLYAAISSDGSQTWSLPHTVVSALMGTGFPLYRPKAGISSAGEILVVWNVAVDITQLNDYNRFASSNDNGETWSTPVDISPLGGTLPNVTSTPRGDVIVGWTIVTSTFPSRTQVETTSRLVPANLPNTGLGAGSATTLGWMLVATILILVGVTLSRRSRRS